MLTVSLTESKCLHLLWMKHADYLGVKSLLRRFVQHRQFSQPVSRSERPSRATEIIIYWWGWGRDTISLRTSQSYLICSTKTNPAAWVTEHLKMWITTARHKAFNHFNWQSYNWYATCLTTNVDVTSSNIKEAAHLAVFKRCQLTYSKRAEG